LVEECVCDSTTHDGATPQVYMYAIDPLRSAGDQLLCNAHWRT